MARKIVVIRGLPKFAMQLGMQKGAFSSMKRIEE
jgi:hypothetical protein